MFSKSIRKKGHLGINISRQDLIVFSKKILIIMKKQGLVLTMYYTQKSLNIKLNKQTDLHPKVFEPSKLGKELFLINLLNKESLKVNKVKVLQAIIKEKLLWEMESVILMKILNILKFFLLFIFFFFGFYFSFFRIAHLDLDIIIMTQK